MCETTEGRDVLSKLLNPLNTLAGNSVYKRGAATYTIISDGVPYTKNQRNDNADAKDVVFWFKCHTRCSSVASSSAVGHIRL
jgi:hypothetical protein